MDLNLEYAAHQHALMSANVAGNGTDRLASLIEASGIAGRIKDFQHGLGAAAACAWSKAQVDNSAQSELGMTGFGAGLHPR